MRRHSLARAGQDINRSPLGHPLRRQGTPQPQRQHQCRLQHQHQRRPQHRRLWRLHQRQHQRRPQHLRLRRLHQHQHQRRLQHRRLWRRHQPQHQCRPQCRRPHRRPRRHHRLEPRRPLRCRFHTLTERSSRSSKRPPTSPGSTSSAEWHRPIRRLSSHPTARYTPQERPSCGDRMASHTRLKHRVCESAVVESSALCSCVRAWLRVVAGGGGTRITGASASGAEEEGTLVALSRTSGCLDELVERGVDGRPLPGQASLTRAGVSAGGNPCCPLSDKRVLGRAGGAQGGWQPCAGTSVAKRDFRCCCVVWCHTRMSSLFVSSTGIDS